MPVDVYATTPQVDGLNLAEPDGKAVIWPTPHDAKIDVATCLRLSLDRFELCDVPVNLDGSFQESQLTNAHGQSVPVITVLRTADITVRQALGNYVGPFIGSESPLLDPCNEIAKNGEVDVFAEWSRVSVDVTISDTNADRANQMYLIVKYIMMSAQKAFREIGYLDIKRVNGVDQTQVSPDSPGAGLIFTRTLSFEALHPDFMASTPTLVHLVKQSLTIPSLDEHPGPVVSTAV